MQPPNKVPGLARVVNGISALSLSSSRQSMQNPLPELMQILETLPDYVGSYKPFLGKPLLHFSNPDEKTSTSEETFTTECWKRITNNGKEQPGLCSFFQAESHSLPSREVVVRERDLFFHFDLIKESIDKSRAISDQIQPSFDYDEALLKIETITKTSCSQLAGEELLMLLVCTYLVGKKSTSRCGTTSLITTLIKIAPTFFTGSHLTVHESVYGHVSWFTHLCNLRLNSNPSGFSYSLQDCVHFINAHILVNGQTGLFTQRIHPDATPEIEKYHPIHLTHGITRFHDWYALCFGLSKLIDEKVLVLGLLKAMQHMPKTDTATVNTLLSMFSILDAISSQGISPNFWSLLSQPDMTFENWQQTKYFAFFCLKILLHCPTCSDCSEKQTPLLATNILEGLCYFAPYCVHDASHVFDGSHFSKKPWFKGGDTENTFLFVLKTCHETLGKFHQNPFALKDLHAHTRAFVSHIPSAQYLKMSAEAFCSLPEQKNDPLYTLCILSVLQAQTVTLAMTPQMTIEKWKSSESFLNFCFQLLQSIQDPKLVARVLTRLYQSRFEITQFIQKLPKASLVNCQELFKSYLRNCHNSNSVLKFLQLLKQKDIDIDFLLSILSHDQFRHLSDTIENEATLFFPGILKNEDIPLLDLYNTFGRGLCLLLGVDVPLSFIERSLEELTHFSEKCVTEKIWYPCFEGHIRSLFLTQWLFSRVDTPQIPLRRELYTQQDFKIKFMHLIEKACSLAPKSRSFIHAIFIKRIIDFLYKLKDGFISTKTTNNELIRGLAHIHTHFYPVIYELLGACDPTDAQNQIRRLSFDFFYPLFFPREFSMSIVCETDEASTDVVEKKIDEHATLFMNLVSSLAEPSSRQKHEDLARKQVVECFIYEIQLLAETPRKRRYDESKCTERITAKNSLIKLINKLFNLIQDTGVKRNCFAEIGKLKSQEHQISPEPSPRELLTEQESTEHKHAFSIKSTGFRVVFEMAG